MNGPVWDGQGKDPWLPARLNARLDAAKHEREIRAGYWSMLSGWMTSTSRRVLRSQRPDADVIHAQAPAWRTAVEHLVHGEIFLAFASAYRRLLGEDYPVDQRAFTNRYLIEVTNRLVRIPEETYDLVAGQMSAGINDGDSIPQLAARVNGVFSLTESERWPNRAVVVARTEAIGALNAGRDDAFKAAAEQEPDTEFERLWLSTEDNRTRPTHQAADLQRVPLGTPFQVGGFELRFPGDPMGPPQEVIQCRCTSLLVEVGESIDLSNRQFKR